MLSRNYLFLAVTAAIFGTATVGLGFSNVPRTDHWKTEYVDLSMTLGNGGNMDQVESSLYEDPIPGTMRFAATWTNVPHMVTFAATSLMFKHTVTDDRGKKEDKVRADFWDIGVLYGRRLLSGSAGVLSVSAGLAYTRVVYEDTAELEDGTKVKGIFQADEIGIPVNVHAMWTVSRGFGLGFDAFGNVNMDNIFYGGGLSFNFGF